MTIMCNSPMRVAPGTIALPGEADLSFDAVAIPSTTDADIAYTISPPTAGVCFANGSKREQIRLRVSAAGTEVVHRARFIRCAGVPVVAFEVRAEVTEGGAPQCTRTATIGVQIPREAIALDVEPPAARRPAARRKKAAPKKAAKKSARKRPGRAAATKKAKRPARGPKRRARPRKRTRRS